MTGKIVKSLVDLIIQLSARSLGGKPTTTKKGEVKVKWQNLSAII